MKRLVLLSLIILAGVASFLLMPKTQPQVVHAASTGCDQFNDPALDTINGGGQVTNVTWDPGDYIRLFATAPEGTELTLEFPIGTVAFSGIIYGGTSRGIDLMVTNIVASPDSVRWTSSDPATEWRVWCQGQWVLLRGGDQTALVNTQYEFEITAEIYNGANNWMVGGMVTFTAPASGPSVIFVNSGTNTITVPSIGSTAYPGPMIANGIPGNFTVVATHYSTISWEARLYNSGFPLEASATCVGDNLQVTITNGDGPFWGGSTSIGYVVPIQDAPLGTYTTNVGPYLWRNVYIHENGGDAEYLQLGTFRCASTGLSAAAVCQQNDLVVTIFNGFAPYTISGNGPNLPATNIFGTSRTFAGPGTWTGLVVAEGDAGQAVELAEVTCPAPIDPPPPPPDDPTPPPSTPPTTPAPPALPGITVPNLGTLTVSVENRQLVLDAPDGNPILIDGQAILVPQDSDGNGFDTFTITEVLEFEGETWVGIFLGGPRWGYIQLLAAP